MHIRFNSGNLIWLRCRERTERGSKWSEGDRRSLQSPESCRMVAWSRVGAEARRGKWIRGVYRRDTVERRKGCEGRPLASSLQKQMDGGATPQEGRPRRKRTAREQRPRGRDHTRHAPSLGSAQPRVAVLLRREGKKKKKTVELIF